MGVNMEFWHYNKVVGIEISKKLGNTNTSDKVADLLLNFINFENTSAKTKFLEPAVGSGSFYFSIVEELISRNFTIREIVEEMIYGYDIDNKALSILKKKLLDNYNYICNENTKIFNKNFLLEKFEINFDYIITNPPYISNKNIEKDELFESKEEYIEYLKDNIDKDINSASDIYVYFQIKCMQLLNAGGKSIFLCSDSWIDSKFGEVIKNYILNKDYNLDLIVNSQLYPFFRDDTNAILTLISKENENENKEKTTKIINLREELKSIDLENIQSYEMTKEDLGKIFKDDRLINKRNALILFFDYYFDIDNFFLRNTDKFEKVKERFEIKTTSLTQAFMEKNEMLLPLTEGETPVFWQIQSRVNKIPNYKNNININELTYSVDKNKVPEKYEENWRKNNFYFSNIIDRYPLLFAVENTETFHVSKYFSIESKKEASSNIKDILLFNNVFTMLDMELRMKEGTRKTLRKGECGLAKEIKRDDLIEVLIPKNISFEKVEENIEKYKNKVIFNIELALQDSDYLTIQKHIAKEMGLSNDDLKFVIKKLIFLYVLRMRNIVKIQNFETYIEDFINKLDIND